MKAEKITVTITVEVLHIDAAPAMIGRAVQQVNDESLSGELHMEDGDCVRWLTTRKTVEF